MRNRFLVPLAALALAMFVPGRASAHALQMTVKLPPDAVIVEATFDDGTPARGAAVVITDAAGNEVAKGRADDTGVCRLAKLGPGKYMAAVELIGHRQTVEFEVADASGVFEFSSWRLDKRVGLAIGVGGLLAVSGAFWWLRRRKVAG